ncbi:hypothetical protein WJX73_008275 [Symbiochloris irregularis]|uniref:Uncharacterized protein n=1 Tax=Symbiochloris irregularis TaxID=706552 RepID=A0AAW1PIK4_9CHLO
MLKVLALVTMDDADLRPAKLACLHNLEALSLAGYRQYRSELRIPLQLTNLRVLDICHIQHYAPHTQLTSHVQDALLKLDKLRLVAATQQMLPMRISQRWKPSHDVDYSHSSEKSRGAGCVEALSSMQQGYMRCMVLQNAAKTGSQPKEDAADRERMQVFDSFWRTCVRMLPPDGCKADLDDQSEGSWDDDVDDGVDTDPEGLYDDVEAELEDVDDLC